MDLPENRITRDSRDNILIIADTPEDQRIDMLDFFFKHLLSP